MTTTLSHDTFHEDVGHAFNELLTLHQFATLTEESRLRVLKSLPTALLQQALDGDPRGAPEPAAAPSVT